MVKLIKKNLTLVLGYKSGFFKYSDNINGNIWLYTDNRIYLDIHIIQITVIGVLFAIYDWILKFDTPLKMALYKIKHLKFDNYCYYKVYSMYNPLLWVFLIDVSQSLRSSTFFWKIKTFGLTVLWNFYYFYTRTPYILFLIIRKKLYLG